MFSVLVIRLRSLRLLRVSGIVMRLRMFLLLITFLKASHSFRNRLLAICKRSEERFSRNAETELVRRLLLEKYICSRGPSDTSRRYYSSAARPDRADSSVKRALPPLGL